MKVILDRSPIKQKFKNLVVAIGVFDGVHLGHQTLIGECIKEAKRLRGTPAVMTFFPHPLHILRPEIKIPFIVSLPYRLKLIEQLGIDVCWVIKFTRRFSHLSAEQFIKRYIVDKMHAKAVVVGDDFHFGKNRGGNLDFLKAMGQKYGFKVKIVSAVKKGPKAISSTRIREFISKGQLEDAERLLGRQVSIMGRVVRGDARGKNLGYPTANINPPANHVILPQGVYVVKVRIENKVYQGVANIGCRPSFTPSDAEVNIEVHIFDFRKDIYGQEIVVEFLKKIRNEKVFQTPQDLILQLKKDEKKARALVSSFA